MLLNKLLDLHTKNYASYRYKFLLPPANEVWGKVMYVFTPPSTTLQDTVNKRLVRILLECILFFTGRNEVVAKVIFLHLSVIHSVHRGEGVCLSA